jgi:hypothetical protein
MIGPPCVYLSSHPYLSYLLSDSSMPWRSLISTTPHLYVQDSAPGSSSPSSAPLKNALQGGMRHCSSADKYRAPFSPAPKICTPKVSTKDTTAHSAICTVVTPPWLQVVVGITGEGRAQRISLGHNREGGALLQCD